MHKTNWWVIRASRSIMKTCLIVTQLSMSSHSYSSCSFCSCSCSNSSLSCLSPWCAGSTVSLTLVLAVFALVLAEAALDFKNSGLEIPLIFKWLAFTNHLSYPKTIIVRFSSFRGYLNVSQVTSATCLNRLEKTGEINYISSTSLWLPCLLRKSAENKPFTLNDRHTTRIRASRILSTNTQHQRAGSICLLSVPYKTCFRSNLKTYLPDKSTFHEGW